MSCFLSRKKPQPIQSSGRDDGHRATSFAIASPGLEIQADAPVITRYRYSESNLRTQFGRIIEQAGLAKWPKPFMALRASRRTELEQTELFTNHTLNEWFGHSGAVAELHYLQVTESDFVTASALNVSVPKNSDTKEDTSGGSNTPSQDACQRKNPGKTRVAMAANGCGSGGKYTPEDSNL